MEKRPAPCFQAVVFKVLVLPVISEILSGAKINKQGKKNREIRG
jgi:hypothetical protein